MGFHAADTLVERILDRGNAACIGLDPDLDRMPTAILDSCASDADAISTFCIGVIDATSDLVPAVKPQSACFERFGAEGVRALEKVCSHARNRNLLVVLDAKRGDIGVSARHYASAARDLGAQFLTVNPFLGTETLEPYLEVGLGIYALVRTSNPGSEQFQALHLENGQTFAERVAQQLGQLGTSHIGKRGLSSVGAVIGATKAASEMSRLRELLPEAPILVPGVGAQGGTVQDVRPLVRPGVNTPPLQGVLVNASRSVLYPPAGDGQWQNHVRAAAEVFANSMAGL